jgi:hypothetical protein
LNTICVPVTTPIVIILTIKKKHSIFMLITIKFLIKYPLYIADSRIGIPIYAD